MIVNLYKVELKPKMVSKKWSATYKFYSHNFKSIVYGNKFDWVVYGKSRYDGKWYNLNPDIDYLVPRILSEKDLFIAITAKQFRMLE